MEFDFATLAIGLAGVSLGGIGAIMAGYFLFPEAAEKYKKQIPTVIVGLILVTIASVLVSTMSSGGGGAP